jgi:molybdate/tungstate transport system ATP-binding protein
MTDPDGQAVDIRDLRIDLKGFSLRDVSLTVPAGAFFLILGPTGAGKTLLLEAVAGLTPINSGTVRVGGRDVTGLPPERRGVGIVYQDYALFPHLTVMDNIAYGIRYLKTGRAEATDRARDFMDRVGIAHLRDRRTPTLSGGERQRVALVRALAVNPAVLLLDEPLSALDPGFRDDIQRLLKALHRETRATFLMVTHDFSEALYLGEQAAILHDGRIEGTGPVSEIFRRPQTPFAARFMGMKNVFPATFQTDRATAGELVLQMAAPSPFDRGHAAIRPEEIRIDISGDGQEVNVLAGRVVETVDRAAYAEIWVQAADHMFHCHVARREWAGLGSRTEPGASVRLVIPPRAIHPLPAESAAPSAGNKSV